MIDRIAYKAGVDLARFRELDFAAVDPGRWGAISVNVGGDYILEIPAHGVEQLTDAVIFGPARWGVDVLIVEAQFVGKSARSGLSLAESSGYVQGYLAATLGVKTIVSVYPASWQAPLGIRSREGNAALEDIYPIEKAPPWAVSNKKLSEGWRSTRAIGDWWMEVAS